MFVTRDFKNTCIQNHTVYKGVGVPLSSARTWQLFFLFRAFQHQHQVGPVLSILYYTYITMNKNINYSPHGHSHSAG